MNLTYILITVLVLLHVFTVIVQLKLRGRIETLSARIEWLERVKNTFEREFAIYNNIVQYEQKYELNDEEVMELRNLVFLLRGHWQGGIEEYLNKVKSKKIKDAFEQFKADKCVH
ncbi:MAG: hypothetical protein WDZ88_02365 [Candidatus Paceibacterota bacterium]